MNQSQQPERDPVQAEQQGAEPQGAEPQGAEPAQETAPAGDLVEDAAAQVQASQPTEPTVEEQLAERTADLQRLQAEYVNYKRRVDRDRELVRAQGEAKVLESLLTVLDDLGRADEHGELIGGFKAVADHLQATVKKHGLEAFGREGDEFDPAFHEAVFQVGESADIDTTTIAQVLRIGYRVGDRVLRAATVGVLQPAADDEPATGDEPTPGSD